MLNSTSIAVPAIVGTITTFIIPIILNQAWPQWLRFLTALLMTSSIATAIVFSYLRPESWESIATVLAIAFAVGQVTYGLLKPTGIYDWIHQVTRPAPPAEGRKEADSCPD